MTWMQTLVQRGTRAIALAALAPGLAGCLPTPRVYPHASRVEVLPVVAPDPALASTRGSHPLGRLRGRWVWLYFGYTNCPDVCPTTLGTLAAAYRRLAHRDRVGVLFVSVDPGRDRPERLARHAAFYDAAFEGATGTRAELQALTAGLGTSFSNRARSRTGVGYAVDHPNAIFVLSPEGRYVATYDAGTRAEDLARDFEALSR